MRVIEIGELAKVHADGRLPEHGIIIEATVDELKRNPINILYNEVDLMRVDGFSVDDIEEGEPQ